jgi:tRNA G18 (ribose-2'-O)-methylase SpoU
VTVRVESVESLDDPRVDAYRNVRDAQLCSDLGLFMAEGRLNVERLLASPRYRARSVFVTQTALHSIERSLAPLGDDTPIYVAAQALMNGIVGYHMHRGCLAAAERGSELDFESLLVGAERAPRCVVALEDVTNPDNVGAVFRNALAFGADAVALTPRCADPLYRKSIRVSMGAVLHVPYARIPDAAAALRRLRAAGFTAVALSAGRGALPRSALPVLPERVALLVGTEAEGLSSSALSEADLTVHIPMAPGVDSLNVAMAAGIALHHLNQARAGGRVPEGGA